MYELLQTGSGRRLHACHRAKSPALFEVAPYITMLPQGMYPGSFTMFISPDFMDSLSDEDAEAIRSVCGENCPFCWQGGKEDHEALNTPKSKVSPSRCLNDDPMAIEYAKRWKGWTKPGLNAWPTKGRCQGRTDMLRAEAADYAPAEN